MALQVVARPHSLDVPTTSDFQHRFHMKTSGFSYKEKFDQIIKCSLFWGSLSCMQNDYITKENIDNIIMSLPLKYHVIQVTPMSDMSIEQGWLLYDVNVWVHKSKVHCKP
ncbi:hypothetical protein MPTK1_2g11070 [Marchantia polymorpha subsp. ruderalis]|uniref:Uncharacterized protein n=1 Tax=Marchantia polymorpha TaxID=3197 RepID=A0A2R6XCB6_MARPO|nr:hypothetical protein MARPO_0023s0073 [Marchantia polymorpha]BBN01888.1 hypothetical protein Mp_2g11070 [Marchantia polymorpha subsp. ruderalis]|eukprot:PTQ43751.1 hypothetical protein MARPO_0023s0073 [Marchantia polymorpha]